MLVLRNNEFPKPPSTVDLVQTEGSIDYVKNGAIYRNQSVKSVMVSSESDLSLLDNYSPGTIAHTAGYKKFWQKGLDGTWVEITEEASDDT